MARQRVRDYHEPADIDIRYGLSALLCGLGLVFVRLVGRR